MDTSAHCTTPTTLTAAMYLSLGTCMLAFGRVQQQRQGRGRSAPPKQLVRSMHASGLHGHVLDMAAAPSLIVSGWRVPVAPCSQQACSSSGAPICLPHHTPCCSQSKSQFRSHGSAPALSSSSRPSALSRWAVAASRKRPSSSRGQLPPPPGRGQGTHHPPKTQPPPQGHSSIWLPVPSLPCVLLQQSHQAP